MKEDKNSSLMSNQGILTQQIEPQGSKIDLGDVSSRSLGKVGGRLGGEMTRRLVEMAQNQMINKE